MTTTATATEQCGYPGGVYYRGIHGTVPCNRAPGHHPGTAHNISAEGFNEFLERAIAELSAQPQVSKE